MTKRLSMTFSLFAVSALCASAGASAQDRSTVCNRINAPDSQHNVGVNNVAGFKHVVNASVNTCGYENTPPAPPCSYTIDEPHIIHLRVYACALVAEPTPAAGRQLSLSVDGLLPPGRTQPPPDCGPTVDRIVGEVEVFACVPNTPGP